MLNHITGGHLSSGGDGGSRSFQPMNVNFGLFPPLAAPPPRVKSERGSKTLARKHALATRALTDLERWLAGTASIAAE
jgi:methylenetetrahydrofolate--tRNA-(uracil-5-)-methyltransferase